MWGVSLTHPVLPSYLCRVFLLLIPCCLDFYATNFSYTSRFLFFVFFPFLLGECFLNIPCWLHFYLGTLYYTSHAGLIFIGEFLWHVPCWLYFYVGSLSYTSHLGSFLSGKFLLHMQASFLSGEYFLHIPCWIYFSVGSFSYTIHAGFFLSFFFFFFFFNKKISLLHPLLASSRAHFIFMWWASLTHLLLTFLCGEFLLHIPCWFHFYLGSFFYTSRAGFNLISGVSLTHAMPVLFISG